MHFYLHYSIATFQMTMTITIQIITWMIITLQCLLRSITSFLKAAYKNNGSNMHFYLHYSIAIFQMIMTITIQIITWMIITWTMDMKIQSLRHMLRWQTFFMLRWSCTLVQYYLCWEMSSILCLSSFYRAELDSNEENKSNPKAETVMSGFHFLPPLNTNAQRLQQNLERLVNSFLE